MCEIGDIILIKNYKSRGTELSKHSFVVIDDSNGDIQGLEYDMICNVMSSFKDDKQKERKLSYPSNFPITSEDTTVINGNDKSGYIKTDQLYLFKKDSIDFTVIGKINEDIFNLIVEFIQESDLPVDLITDNL